MERKKLQSEKIKSLCCSPNVHKVTKSGTLSWKEHVAKLGEERGAFNILTGSPTEMRPLRMP